jgi:hypothetical protein
MQLLDRQSPLEGTKSAPDPEALFPEARRRERRRRLGIALAVLLVAGGAGLAVGIVGGGSGGNGKTTSSQSGRPGNAALPISASVSSLVLSPADRYESLAVVGGRLILSGGPHGSPFASGGYVPETGVRPSGICHAATVDPSTLRLSHVTSGSCENPALYGENVLPVNYIASRKLAPGAGGPTLTVRIARVDRAAPGGYTLGPVVMNYQEGSGTDVQWIYGDGSLWIYDSATPRGAELLRVSETTGAVEQRVAMPDISRPLIATDADGFWLAAANTSLSSSKSEWGLYRVSPGMTAPVKVRSIPRSGAFWLVASGHTVWLNLESTLWRLDGPRATDKFHATYGGAQRFNQLEPATGDPTFAGNTAVGLFEIVPGVGPKIVPGVGQNIIWISPSSGIWEPVATVKPPKSFDVVDAEPPAVLFHGSLFFLDPPGPAGYPAVPSGFSAVYRVTPKR